MTNHIISLLKTKLKIFNKRLALQQLVLFKEHHRNIYTMIWVWECLGDRRWCSKLTLFYKIVNGFAPKYLANYLNINDNWVYKTRASEHNNIKRFGTRTENFKQSFFPFCVNKWCIFDISLRKAENIKRFKSMLKDFVNLKQKSLFAIHDPGGVKLLSSLRLNFSHLNEHKFCHNFKDTLSPYV